MRTLKISAGSLTEVHDLEVLDAGVAYRRTGPGATARRFAFAEVDAVLLSSGGLLSIQVGEEVFAIPTQGANPRHPEAIRALVAGVERR